jgi:hypothetical protein
MTDFRALCARMADELDHYRQLLMDDRRETHALANEARAALAQSEPVVLTRTDCFDFAMDFLGGTEEVEVRNYIERLESNASAALTQPEPVAPTDKELLELMPETMRDEFSYAAKVCSDATGGQVKPGIFRVALNTAALECARAVLARWGTPANTINQEGFDG